MSSTENVHDITSSIAQGNHTEAVRDPVFVICNGRSGSTLLRFLLDAHPELACPPETNLPALCAQLATVWALIEGAPLSANRGDQPPNIPEAAIVGTRHTLDLMIGSYLYRRGKRRYCDKSLGTARYAKLLLRVYPEARFICLYRHPMDVIASGIEACPWGLEGFGFDAYIAETPGNSVMALARYWADHAETVIDIESQFPASCHRVRYEDLVADTDHTIAGIFTFLGVAPAPGVSADCFSSERERFGPADYKIWRTSHIDTASVGRGWSVPSAMIGPSLLEALNELLGKLDYLPIDESWGTSGPPGDLRLPAVLDDPVSADKAALGLMVHHGSLAATTTTCERPPATGGAGAFLLGEHLRAGLTSSDVADWLARSGPHAEETFVVVAASTATTGYADYWLVDLKSRIVKAVSSDAQDKSDWDIVGSADAWQRVINHELNLNVALRSCQLRYCDENDAGPVPADARLNILACILGIGAW
jgi:hypothetical protein